MFVKTLSLFFNTPAMCFLTRVHAQLAAMEQGHGGEPLASWMCWAFQGDETFSTQVSALPHPHCSGEDAANKDPNPEGSEPSLASVASQVSLSSVQAVCGSPASGTGSLAASRAGSPAPTLSPHSFPASAACAPEEDLQEVRAAAFREMNREIQNLMMEMIWCEAELLDSSCSDDLEPTLNQYIRTWPIINLARIQHLAQIIHR